MKPCNVSLTVPPFCLETSTRICPRANSRANQINAALAPYGLTDLLLHYKQRTLGRDLFAYCFTPDDPTQRLRQSRCEYILSPDRRQFKTVQIRKPQYYVSDHRMVVAKYLLEPAKCHCRYLKGRKALTIHNALRSAAKDGLPFPASSGPNPCPAPTQTTQPASLGYQRRPSRFGTSAAPSIGLNAIVRLSPAASCENTKLASKRIVKRWTEKVAENIIAYLSGDEPDLRAAYQEVAKWYHFFGGRPPKPSREDLRKVAKTYQAIYSASPPRGDPIPTIVKPAPVDDSVPGEPEIGDAVRRLRINKATGPSGMKVEHFKEWYVDAHPEPKPGDPEVPIPRPEKWNRLVELVQRMFRTGEVPTKCVWSFLAVIPKPDGGQRGVGLVEAAWKVCEAIIDTRVKKVIRFHDILHGFCQTRDTSTGDYGG